MSQAPGGPGRATILAFAGVVLIGGMNAVAVRQSVLELAPLWAAALRFGVAGLILIAFVLGTRRPIPRGRGLWGAALYGAIGFAGAFGFISTGLQDVGAGPGSVLLAVVPLLTFGLAILQGQERFHVQGLAGALIALVGIAVVFADQMNQDVPLLALALILIGTACIAEAGVVLKWVPRGDPFATNAVAMLSAAGLLLVGSLVSGEPLAAPTVVHLATLGSVVMFGLYLFALSRWTASAVSYVTLLMPVVAITVATLATGERFSISYIVGGVVVGAGVYIGAFLRIRPHRTSATSLPECLPIDACAEPAASGAGPAPRVPVRA